MASPQVRFTWNIHWSCNYRCSYCFFDGRWAEYGRRNVYQSVDQWMGHWRRIYEKYGRCYLTINGGEPFAYPNFVELMVQVSSLHWPINVTTNTSLHLKDFVGRVDPAKVSISISFHPQYHTIDEFLKTVRFLRERRANIGCINFVAWPPFLKDLAEYIRRFQAEGESLKVIPFIGAHEGVNYPDNYSEGQKKILGLTDNWLESKRHEGMLCRAGHQSALLLPTGKVARCGQIGDRYLIGDFFQEGFSLMKEPMPCDEQFCPCDEWKVIPDEKPPEKAGAWLP
ncbi:MAG TPA: radical SAM protein [Elusimicrobiota bacterium]|nr:radical SAM protein [Elusimicrobiota bacterium]